MARAVNEQLMFRVADALGLDLTVSLTPRTVNGAIRRTIRVGSLSVDVPLAIVSSRFDDKECLLLLRSMGNLALFVSAGVGPPFDRMTVHLLNVTKMDTPSGLIERLGDVTGHYVTRYLKPAIVKSFQKVSPMEWAPFT